ncbi:UNKNOWN [Stylonychia lemnae]|uniref:Uncharacterized protein n=1 Tax=Stylonychia lemnae TaxID=5949 RepID=A0A078A5V4_STYLE|nr:UNKNOWN [Stylonychia lemnae]|eukprot:CDW76930.1 UNKNOWN [Stylonychia lemnae]
MNSNSDIEQNNHGSFVNQNNDNYGQYEMMPSTGGVMSVVERTKLWAEYKEKKIKDAKDQKDKQDKDSTDCTFKPQINNYQNKRRTARGVNQDDSMAANKGLDKYMQRMDKAREMKEEMQILEEKLFKKGQNWKPKLTTPVEPKLSSYIKKNEKESQNPSNIKSLNKPVNPIINDYSKLQKSQASRSNDEQEDGDRNGFSPSQIKNTQDFVKLTQKCKGQFVELRSDMNYDEAISLIHQHILNLDI